MKPGEFLKDCESYKSLGVSTMKLDKDGNVIAIAFWENSQAHGPLTVDQEVVRALSEATEGELINELRARQRG